MNAGKMCPVQASEGSCGKSSIALVADCRSCHMAVLMVISGAAVFILAMGVVGKK